MIFASPQYSGNTVTGTCGIIIDMSEHEAMETALRESEKNTAPLSIEPPTEF
ncbi:MAG: hypothetical protein HC896_18965 [Bacteroidales bacterium]|nr:hypothetical protein [Bacteroidales bacterium]